MNKEAAFVYLYTHNLGRKPNELDLHGLQVKEAKKAVVDFLRVTIPNV